MQWKLVYFIVQKLNSFGQTGTCSFKNIPMLIVFQEPNVSWNRIFLRLFPDKNRTFQFHFVCPTNFPLGEFLLTIKSESREQIEHPIHVRRKLKCKYANFFSRCYFFFVRELLTYAMCINFRFALKHFRKIIINVGKQRKKQYIWVKL